MTTPDIPRTRPVELIASRTEAGCVHCGSQATVQLHPFRGRLCADVATLPPGGFDTGLADDMAAAGRADRSFSYLAAWLAAEVERRFDVLAGSWR
jgi:hypothetical protein